MEFKGSRKTNIPIMQVLQKKKATTRLPIFLKKPQATKKNMPKSGLNF